MGEISMSGSTREGGAAVIGLRASHPVLSPLLYWFNPPFRAPMSVDRGSASAVLPGGAFGYLGRVRVLIAGCGYLGLALGARLVSLGHEVTGLRRPGSDPGPLRAVGVAHVAADLGRAEEVAALP